MKGKITISRVSCSHSDDYIEIRITDTDSVIARLDVKMSLEEFATAVTGLGHVDCELDANRLDLLGKKRISQKLEFELPDEYYSEKRRVTATEIAESLCPKGWVVSSYFGGQDSFFRRDGKPYARTHCYQWVDDDDS